MDQHKEEEKKQGQIKQDALQEEKEGKVCPHCNYLNEPEARFCSECGYDFHNERICPYCGMKVQPGIDICNYCGEWLLEGVCKFCGAEVEDGQIFCGQCGSLLKGIVCPQCGQLSNFDFCPRCNIPLTPKAKSVYEEIKEVIETTEGTKLFEKSLFEQKEKISSEKEELLKLKAYLEKANKKEKKKKAFTPLFSERQKESIKSMAEIADKELKRQEEERQKREEEEKKKLFARSEGTIYIAKEKIQIIIKNEDGIIDDSYWLYINDIKIGYVEYPIGGGVSLGVVLHKGINKVELKLARCGGAGTVASINFQGSKYLFGGSTDHIWMVINK